MFLILIDLDMICKPMSCKFILKNGVEGNKKLWASLIEETH